MSDDAKRIGDSITEVAEDFLESLTLGEPLRRAMESLWVAFEEASAPGWDGYEANPADPRSFILAERILEQIPTSCPMPEASVDPDGEISLEWYVSPRRVFSISIAPDGGVSYAGMFGVSTAYGTEHFGGDFPEELIPLIKRVHE